MSYASQNYSRNANYNSPRFISPLFLVVLTTAFLSAILAAAMASPLRPHSPRHIKQKPNLTLKSIFGTGEEGDSPITTENKDSSVAPNPRLEIAL